MSLSTVWWFSSRLTNWCVHFNSQSLQAGTGAVPGTSVNAGWWTGQTEPDGSTPSGSSVQSTCINEEPQAGTAAARAHTPPVVCWSMCACACAPLGWPVLTSCCKLLPVDSGVFLLLVAAPCRRSLPPASALVLFCGRVCLRCVHLLLFLSTLGLLLNLLKRGISAGSQLVLQHVCEHWKFRFCLNSNRMWQPPSLMIHNFSYHCQIITTANTWDSYYTWDLSWS